MPVSRASDGGKLLVSCAKPHRKADFISASMGNVKSVLMEPAVVIVAVAVILFLFLLNARHIAGGGGFVRLVN